MLYHYDIFLIVEIRDNLQFAQMAYDGLKIKLENTEENCTRGNRTVIILY